MLDLPPIDPDYLTWTRDDLTRLRHVDAQHGTPAVYRDVVRHADHLARTLRTIPRHEPRFREVARLTVEAAELASLTTWDLARTDIAVQWARVATAAATITDDPDLYALGIQTHATKLGILGHGREVEALALFDYLNATRNRRQRSPVGRAFIDTWHANLLAQRRPRQAATVLKLLDRAAEALTGSTDLAPLWAYTFNLGCLAFHRGHALAQLGFTQDADQTLTEVLRRCPSRHVRGVGSIHLELAHAAALQGEADRAAAHAVTSLEAFRGTGSIWRAGTVAVFRDQLVSRFGPGVAVELDVRLRQGAAHGTAGPRYVLIRSYNRPDHSRPVVHLASCPFVQRSRRSWPWPELTGRPPRTLADDPDVRAAAQPCRRCLGKLWR